MITLPFPPSLYQGVAFFFAGNRNLMLQYYNITVRLLLRYFHYLLPEVDALQAVSVVPCAVVLHLGATL